MSKRILISGGAGYIGSHVCKQLALNGFNPNLNASIICIDSIVIILLRFK